MRINRTRATISSNSQSQTADQGDEEVDHAGPEHDTEETDPPMPPCGEMSLDPPRPLDVAAQWPVGRLLPDNNPRPRRCGNTELVTRDGVRRA